VSPITHFLSGWVLASSVGLERRDRLLVTMAGIIPDVDGFGLPFEVLTRSSAHPITWWSDYHHVVGHNVGFALLTGVAALLLSRRKRVTVALVLLSFHLHLLEDLVGARGPDGHQWPIPYLLPFSNWCQWAWKGQWALNAWPNFVLTLFLLGLTLYYAWKTGYSPLGLLSSRADAALVQALRRRFGAVDSAQTETFSNPLKL
jgi:hypothetical protein